jgi:hypothetical protein
MVINAIKITESYETQPRLAQSDHTTIQQRPNLNQSTNPESNG